MSASMRKRCLSFVLPLLLLFAQQGALRHEIGHLQRQAPTEAPAGAKHHGADRVCETCLAYGVIGALAQPTVPALLLADVHDVVPSRVDVVTLAADAPSPRSRGPPWAL